MPRSPRSSPSRNAADVTLEATNQALRNQLAERKAWLRLLHSVTSTINDAAAWDDALHHVLQRLCETGGWRLGFIYLPAYESPDGLTAAIAWLDDERFRPFRAASMRYVAVGESLPGRVYAGGAAIWATSQCDLLRLIPYRAETARQLGLVSAAAFPARFGGEILAVVELFSDRAHVPSEELLGVMADVAAQIARVLERERSATRIADLVWHEQQSLLHMLHDSLGQTLTGLGMLSSLLSQRLTTDPSAADVARQIFQQAQVALDEVRSLSKGLFPVEIGADGLLVALRYLATTMRTVHGVAVQVANDIPALFRDARLATQLYRIAQEAATNAVKHGRARVIEIAMSGDGDSATLRIADDGVGIAAHPQNQNGLGLRIMRYRARSIGGSLTIARGERGGTVVTCSVHDTPAATAVTGWPESRLIRIREPAS